MSGSGNLQPNSGLRYHTDADSPLPETINPIIDAVETNAASISLLEANVLYNIGTGVVLTTIQLEWENLPVCTSNKQARLYAICTAGASRRLGVAVIDKTNNSNGQALVLDESGNTLHTLTNGVWS